MLFNSWVDYLPSTMQAPLPTLEETCRKLSAKGTYFTSYATVENREIRDFITFNTEMGQRVQLMWEKCNEALLGIGTVEQGTVLSPDLVRSEEAHALKEAWVIGDVLGHCFNKEGAFVQTELMERLVRVDEAHPTQAWGI